ncbi:MAG: hypothetical protein KAI69_03245 [Deltaproteobacteria bacterium]|nr:hypothetical protein [Deltaproteobacteria bacterium]
MHMYTTESESRAGLYSNNNIDIPLQSVNVKAAFSNLFCETTLTQTYLNSEKKPIEAIYTFPLSPRAVLLGLEVTIGERKLQGLIVEKNSAEEQYEEAIKKAEKSTPADKRLVDLFRDLLTEISEDNWGPGFAEEGIE